MKYLFTHITLILFLFTFPSLADDRLEAVKRMKGSDEMSTKVTQLMGALNNGSMALVYHGHGVYGDGGSFLIIFKLNKQSKLVFFYPRWNLNNCNDVRVGITTAVDEDVPKWSKTLGEDPKLRAEIVKVLTTLTNPEKEPNIKGEQTDINLKSILKHLKKELPRRNIKSKEQH